MSHEMGMSRSPRPFMGPKATRRVALRASGARTAGVADQITCARRPWEPAKPRRVLRLVSGGEAGQGTTGGGLLGAAGWRIGT